MLRLNRLQCSAMTIPTPQQMPAAPGIAADLFPGRPAGDERGLGGPSTMTRARLSANLCREVKHECACEDQLSSLLATACLACILTSLGATIHNTMGRNHLKVGCACWTSSPADLGRTRIMYRIIMTAYVVPAYRCMLLPVVTVPARHLTGAWMLKAAQRSQLDSDTVTVPERISHSSYGLLHLKSLPQLYAFQIPN